MCDYFLLLMSVMNWKITLDTNCMIAVDDKRQEADAIQRILAAFDAGKVDCAMAASSAAEMQKDRNFLNSVTAFEERRTGLGFGDLELLKPIARWGMSFWGFGLWTDDEMSAREKAIFEAMFPNSHYQWEDFARSRALDSEDRSPQNTRKWRNQILDAQAFWAHENARRDYFVTTDKEFLRLERKGLVSEGTILRPDEAVRKLSL